MKDDLSRRLSYTESLLKRGEELAKREVRLALTDVSQSAKKGGFFMLQINHLTISHKKDLRTILEDFSFVLNRGDKAVLVGEEGNGKSTLLRWIYDPALIEDYAEARGIRNVQGEILAYLPQELPEAEKEKMQRLQKRLRSMYLRLPRLAQ